MLWRRCFIFARPNLTLFLVPLLFLITEPPKLRLSTNQTLSQLFSLAGNLEHDRGRLTGWRLHSISLASVHFICWPSILKQHLHFCLTTGLKCSRKALDLALLSLCRLCVMAQHCSLLSLLLVPIDIASDTDPFAASTCRLV